MLDTLAPGEYSRTKKLIEGTESEKYGRRSLCVLKNQTELRPIRFDIKYRVISFFRFWYIWPVWTFLNITRESSGMIRLFIDI